MNIDFTTGAPMKKLLMFSLPIFIGSIFQLLYNVVDSIVVGRFVSAQALAAVGSVGSLVFLILGFAGGITTGCSVISSQRYGAKDYEGLKKSFATSIVISIITTITFMLIGLFATRPLLALINTPIEIVDLAYNYVLIIYLGAITSTTYNAGANIIRSLGDSKTPLYFLIFSSILNVVFDLLFTIVIPMGVAGVALATVLAQAISAILCIIYIVKKQPLLHISREHFAFDKAEYALHLKTSLPMAFQFSIISIGFVAVQSAINQFGTSAIAAISIVNKIEQFATLIFPALGSAVTTYCAHNVGARKYNRVITGTNQALLLAMIIAVITTAICLVFKNTFILFFTTPENVEIIQLANQYVSFLVPFLLFLSVLFIIRQALQGLGITMFCLVVSIIELVVRLIVATFLPLTLGFTGLCLSSPLAWITASSLFIVRYIIYIKNSKKFDKEFVDTNLAIPTA